MDRAGTYRADRKTSADEPLADQEPTTQFGRAMDGLGVVLILANGPQAKGRVERRNRLLQDRLVKEMRLLGISSIAAARWRGAFLQIDKAHAALDLPGQRVLLRHKRDGTLLLEYSGQRLTWTHTPQCPTRPPKLRPPVKNNKAWKPPVDHRWRRPADHLSCRSTPGLG